MAAGVHNLLARFLLAVCCVGSDHDACGRGVRVGVATGSPRATRSRCESLRTIFVTSAPALTHPQKSTGAQARQLVAGGAARKLVIDWNASRISTGKGKIMVELFSEEISAMVCS